MRTFFWVSGELTEVQRFINVPMRWCEQYRARERRELWITTDAGREMKFVVHTRYLPARRGHRVAALVCRCEVVALLNLTTGDGVNFYRADPPLLWKRCDGAVLVAVALAAVVAAAALGRPEWLLVLPLLSCAALAPRVRHQETQPIDLYRVAARIATTTGSSGGRARAS